jgi:hypothetical protein
MIWILVASACAYVSIALLILALLRTRHRQALMMLPLRRVRMPGVRPANENGTPPDRLSAIEAVGTARLLGDVHDDIA